MTRARLETTLLDLMAPASRRPRANAAENFNHQERARDGYASVINRAGRSASGGGAGIAFKTSSNASRNLSRPCHGIQASSWHAG